MTAASVDYDAVYNVIENDLKVNYDGVVYNEAKTQLAAMLAELNANFDKVDTINLDAAKFKALKTIIDYFKAAYGSTGADTAKLITSFTVEPVKITNAGAEATIAMIVEQFVSTIKPYAPNWTV